MRIAVAGRKSETLNYVEYVKRSGHTPFVTLDPGELAGCQTLILPGGGDITPAFFGEKNRGSRNIDTELDILQLQALDLAVKKGMPVLGICKGLQLINVGFGGTIVQDMPTAWMHRYNGADQYHASVIARDSWLHELYGNTCTVNSAHHQSVGRLGAGLLAVQFCPEDDCIEAIAHSRLPVFGVQWHPERIDESLSKLSGLRVLEYVVRSALSCPSPDPCRRADSE